MPIPFATFLPLIGSAVEGISNVMGQSSQNKQQMEMMQQQRQWAIEDRDYQNNYNSPKEQMARLKEAGLNPNLVYGSGNAIQSAATTRPTENARTQPVQANLVNSMVQGFLAMYDLQKTQAQTDQIKAQADLARSNARLNNNKAFYLDANTGLANVRTDFMKFQKQLGTDLAPYQLGYADLRNSNMLKQNYLADLQAGKLKADTAYTKNQDRRADDANQREWNMLNPRIKQMTVAASQGEMSIKQMAENIIKIQVDTSNNAYQKYILQQQLLNMRSEGRKIDEIQKKLERENATPWIIWQEAKSLVPFMKKR